TEAPEFLLVPADPHADREPPARERVERGELLREDHRIALRDDEDARPEPQTGMSRPDPGERLDRVEIRPVVGGIIAAIDEDVIRRPNRFEAEPVARRARRVDGLRG